MVTASKLPVDSNASATEMAETIFGDGVTVLNASYSGDGAASGIFSDGDTIAPGATPGDSGVILSTGRADDYTNSPGNGPPWAWWLSDDANQQSDTSTNTNGADGNPAFDAAAGAATFDASYLDVDFVPDGELMTMKFIFASEEYPEYATEAFQDFVGVWVNGSQVPISVGDGDVDPNNVNAGSNANLFLDNSDSAYNTEMDGLTVTMTLTMPVNPNEVNSVRVGIADVTDSAYDSNLLIASGSVQTSIVAMDDTANLHPDGSKTLDLLANDVNAPGSASLLITHLNGQAVSAGDSVTLNSGQQVTLNSDGTVTVLGDGDTESFNFTYDVENGSGDSDVGFVTVDSVPCFVAGTLIATPSGEVPVEDLLPGDLVLTKDEGAQPLRWVGRRTVAAQGDFAPIRLAAGTFGPHRDLVVSPLHRILIRDSLSELLFGEPEVLVAARDLLNGNSVQRVEGGDVEYVHILLDRHQVVFSEGLETESFLPGPQVKKSFEADIVREICMIFPEIDPETGAGYSPAARRMLKRYEARLLVSGQDRAA